MPTDLPSGIARTYALSLGWTAILFSVGISSQLISDLVFVDFVHGNPYRTQSNAVEMMFLFPAIFSIAASIGVFLTFSIPQIFQAALDRIGSKFAGRFSPLLILAALPVTALITWLCWDYLTPSDVNLGINEGPDWSPYKHGVSWGRYLGALKFQVPQTLFNVCYRYTGLLGCSSKYVLVGWIVLATVCWAFSGHSMAVLQENY